MVLGDLLSRQKHDDSSPHEIIPILFNMQLTFPNSVYMFCTVRPCGKEPYLVCEACTMMLICSPV